MISLPYGFFINAILLDGWRSFIEYIDISHFKPLALIWPRFCLKADLDFYL